MDTDSRKQIYNNIYKSIRYKDGHPALLALVITIYLTFFAGISAAGVLVNGKVYALLPDEGLVALSRIIGIFSLILYIILVIIVTYIFENKTKPIYGKSDELNSDTQLLVKNSDGKIGFFSIYGAWTELKSVEILREDEKLIKVRCQFYNTESELNFRRKNYIAKDDWIYNDIRSIATAKQTKKRNYVLVYIFILITFVAMLLFNIRLVGVRDSNRIQLGCTAEITIMV